MLDKIRFTICAHDREMIKIYYAIFGDLENFQVRVSDIMQIKADCIVSPGNSYGLMDGGVDGVIAYGLDMIDRTTVRPAIQKYFQGEQPVGTSIIFKTPASEIQPDKPPAFKYLAHTPTMRVPKNVNYSDNAYLAFRALLSTLLTHNRENNGNIESVVLTPFCTGSGEMNPEKSAQQMRLAYDLVSNPRDCSWESANYIEKQLDEIHKKFRNK